MKLESKHTDETFQISIFADMVGFSGYDDERGAELAQLHNSIVRNAFEKIGINQKRSDGDGLFLISEKKQSDLSPNFFMFLFSAINAIRRACNKKGIRTKIGISYGVVFKSESGDDIYGSSINMAARLCGLARANQVLFCDKFFALLEEQTSCNKLLGIGRSCYVDCIAFTFGLFCVYRHIGISLKNMGEVTVYELAYRKCSMGKPGRAAFAEQAFRITAGLVKKYPCLQVFEEMHFTYIDNERPFSHQKTNQKTVAFYLSGLGLDHDDYAKMLETTPVRSIAFNLLGFGQNELNSKTYARFLTIELADFIALIQVFFIEIINRIQKETHNAPQPEKLRLIFEGFSFGATFALLWASKRYCLRPPLPNAVKKVCLLLKDPNTGGHGFISSQFATISLADAGNVNYVASRLGVHSHESSQIHVSKAVQWQAQVDFAKYFTRITDKFAKQGSFVPVVHLAQLVLRSFSLRPAYAIDEFGKRNETERKDEFETFAQLLQQASNNNIAMLLTFDGDADGMLSTAWVETYKQQHKIRLLTVQSDTQLSHFDLVSLENTKHFQKILSNCAPCA